MPGKRARQEDSRNNSSYVVIASSMPTTKSRRLFSPTQFDAKLLEDDSTLELETHARESMIVNACIPFTVAVTGNQSINCKLQLGRLTSEALGLRDKSSAAGATLYVGDNEVSQELLVWIYGADEEQGPTVVLQSSDSSRSFKSLVQEYLERHPMVEVSEVLSGLRLSESASSPLSSGGDDSQATSDADSDAENRSMMEVDHLTQTTTTPMSVF